MRDRIEKINDYIQEKGEVKLTELEMFIPDVSTMTLRRDLELLEHRGDIIRIRGGARSISSISKRLIAEQMYSLRKNENTEEKKVIASKAVQFLSEGRSIYIDAGTTSMSFATALPDMHLSVLTSAPNIALELMHDKNITTTIVGGQISNENIAISGSSSIEFIRHINIDVAFMATSGFSLETGFTTGNSNEAELKRQIIKKARKVIMLMDSSKLEQNLMFTFATLKDIDVIVTDGPLHESIVKAANRDKVQII
ncbi:MAG: DeoR/GlpR transcriptional regulator [Clostridia bacterium]|nr:DeoR/GlpR transcriptional regulator [Clostridia bacterium]MBR2972833.1 DeoR/GlpR transcriptional regulator [Clostridia bacterium]